MNKFIQYCLEKGLPANLKYTNTGSTKFTISFIPFAYSYQTFAVIYHFDNSKKELILNTAKTKDAQYALALLNESYKAERYKDVDAFYNDLLIEFANYMDVISKIKKIEIIHNFEGI